MRTQTILCVPAIGLMLALTGCPTSDDGDDEVGDTTDTTTDAGTDTTTDAGTDTTDTGGLECLMTTHAPNMTGAPDGDPCSSGADCLSNLCVLFQDAPPVEGTCTASPTMCETHFSGRLINFETRMIEPDVDIKVAAALQAALMPTTATALAMGTSDANGEIDFVSDAQLSAPLGLVGLSSKTGFFLTATGLASPADGSFYGPGNAIHDIWAVPGALLTSFSMMLEADPEFANQLPLGETGGVVGLVRDATTGDPIAGAVVVSTDDASGSVIRYLNEAEDGFVEDMTTSNGVFVLVKPGLGEVFGLEVGGVPVDGETGTAGSANGAIFTLIFNVP